MKKAILISIRPEWVARILNGEKTIEIRKTAPKCDLPIDAYIYCTKNKLHYSVGALVFNNDDCFKSSVDGTYKYGDSVELMGYSPDYPYDKNNFLNGKVVAKFTLRKTMKFADGSKPLTDFSDILRRACLTKEEALEYRKGKPLFAWHISDLIIFDEPKELGDFFSLHETYHHDHESMVDYYERKEARRLKRAPQSWKFVEVEK